MRKLAVKAADELIKTANPEFKDNLIVLKADLLRRSGEFERLIKEYGGLTFDEEILNRTITLQIKLAHAEDDSCYTLKDVAE